MEGTGVALNICLLIPGAWENLALLRDHRVLTEIADFGAHPLPFINYTFLLGHNGAKMLYLHWRSSRNSTQFPV